jgi:tRNA1Val (adenine37-N6)-methyltransferase
MAFRFKQFEVEDNNSSMKVGTDAVLLGSWVDVQGVQTILDIGTGCGIISLMLAQRSKAIITGIDIDKDSVVQARQNGINSPWANRLDFLKESLRDHVLREERKYDLIVTNPPYFSRSLTSPERKRNLSRHQESLTFADIFALSPLILTNNGRLALVFQGTGEATILKTAAIQNAYPTKVLRVITRKGKPGSLILAELVYSAVPAETNETNLLIHDEDEKFNREYINLTKDFYLDF